MYVYTYICVYVTYLYIHIYIYTYYTHKLAPLSGLGYSNSLPPVLVRKQVCGSCSSCDERRKDRFQHDMISRCHRMLWAWDIDDSAHRMIPSGINCYITMERSTMLLMGKSTISMAIFNSYVSLPEGTTPKSSDCSHGNLAQPFLFTWQESRGADLDLVGVRETKRGILGNGWQWPICQYLIDSERSSFERY